MPALPPQVVVKIIHETLYVLLIIICDYLQGDKGMRGQWAAICLFLGNPK